MTHVSISTYKHLLLASSALMTLSPAIAMAQDAAPAQADAVPAEEAVDEGETIIVTGSLITNPNLERSSPVNIVGADEIELNQSNVAEEVLRELPGVVPNIGSAVNNGNGGASFVDLRGLGNNRNIVLLDGVRLVPSNFVGRVDLNNIPLALVERVDALTGGASTTYGADAVSGVVNFITKQDFAGVEIQASEQITEEGDGNVFRIDATIGANFDDGRGNAVFSIGYQQADPVYQGARDISIFSLDSQTGGSGGSSTTVPSAFSFSGGGGLSGNRQIDPALGMVRPTGPGVYAPFNFAPFNIFQTPFERFNMYGQARYEINDAIEVYTRGLFSKNVVQTIVAPGGAFGLSVQIPLSNPFLPVGLRDQFCANNDSDNNVLNGIQTLTPAQCAAAAAATSRTDPNYREITTNLRRRTVEAGPRISDFQTTVFDYRIGARGAISDSINWDVFGAYGQSENIQALQNYTLSSRIRDALLATNPNTCLSGSAGCVPLNVFGPPGSITPAQLPYLRGSSTSTNGATLAQARATISGDFGASTPWADEPIGFAIGGEYRKYGATQLGDFLSAIPGELGGAGGSVAEVNGGFDVYEALAELVVPLVEDKPFFESLTIEAGVRYSHYTIDAPTSPSFNTTTFKAGGSWEPGAGVKFRGNYSRAVRAPNIGELFFPSNTSLTNLSLDPCQAIYPGIGANPNLANANFRAVCLAQGAPLSAINSIPEPSAGQINATATGNLNLKPETSNSYTFGLVFQPEFVSGLNITVDYYNIKVTDAISQPTPADAIALCFGTPNAAGVYTSVNAASASNPDCTSTGRDPGTGELNSDPATTRGVFQPFTNSGKIETDGIDLAVNYRGDIGFAKLALSFFGNYTFNSKFQAIVGLSLDRECTGYYSTNCLFTGSIVPKFQWSQRTTLSFENGIDVSLLWRHIDGFVQEPDDAINGNGPAFKGNIPGYGDVDFGRIPAYDYFDLAGRFGITDNVVVTLSVQNLFDKKPPNVGSTIASTAFNSGNTFPSTYDALGRKFAAGVKLTF